MKIDTNLKNLDNHKKFIKICRLIEDFLEEKKYVQIDVPVLSPALIPESYLEIFETENLLTDKKEKMYLTPSPELFLKRLMVEGIESCFYLGKCFRNKEPNSNKHSPEFTMLELYKISADYFEVANEILKLIQYLSLKLFGNIEISYQGKKISFKEYEKITVAEAFKKYADIDDIFNQEEFFRQSKIKGFRVDGMNYVDVWSQIYGLKIEPYLGINGKPTVIYDYPRELAAITQVDEVKNIAQRLEIYIEGIELANCGNEATENTNMKEHKNRFKKDINIRKNLGMIDYKPDYKFLDVLENLPISSGVAVGVDRLAMIFANVKSIQELRLINFE